MSIGLKSFNEDFVDQNNEKLNVEVVLFGGFQGLKLQSKMARLALPMLKIFKGFEKFKGLSQLDTEDLNLDTSSFVDSLLQNLTEDVIASLFKELLSKVSVNGLNISDESNFNNVFAGNYALMVKIVKFVIDKNNFFGGGGIGKMISSAMSMLPDRVNTEK